MKILICEALRHSYGEHRALDACSLALEQGKLHVLLGPSGCGKSTLLDVIAGLQPCTQGRIILRGAEISQQPPQQRGILDSAGNIERKLNHRLSGVTPRKGLPALDARFLLFEIGGKALRLRGVRRIAVHHRAHDASLRSASHNAVPSGDLR